MLIPECFLLHTRKLSDTKLIATLFSPELGKFSGVVRLSKSKSRPTLIPQAFKAYQATVAGLKDLKNIQSLDEDGPFFRFSGKQLFCAMYVNELIYYLVSESNETRPVYTLYIEVLKQLAVSDELATLETALRAFEYHLLEELGYGIDFYSATDGQSIEAKMPTFYHFSAQSGFTPVDESLHSRASSFSSTDICALRIGDFSEPQVRRSAKLISRKALNFLLEGRPIKSRELF